MAEGKPGETLIAFESGHYKKVRGKWMGDAVWMHYEKIEGGILHVNKEKVEYTESFGNPDSLPGPSPDERLDKQKVRTEIDYLRAVTNKVKGETNHAHLRDVYARASRDVAKKPIPIAKPRPKAKVKRSHHAKK
jgi:hypothetical protein